MTYTHSFIIYQIIMRQIYGILPEGEVSLHEQLTING